MSGGTTRDVSKLIAWAKKALSQPSFGTDMTSLALRLNDTGFARLDGVGKTALADVQRSVEQAKAWLRGAFHEIAIGWFSRVHGLPVPSGLVQALTADRVKATAKSAQPIVAAQVSAEMQWVRTTEVFATATAGADTAGRLQSAAAEQIDAASYALDLLLEEIGPLMIYSRKEEEPEVRRYERRTPRVALPKQPTADAAVETAAA